jgi:hypothetical protein
MECGICGSYRHNTLSCPEVVTEAIRNEHGQYICSLCGKAWGQNNYAVECCTAKGRGRK